MQSPVIALQHIKNSAWAIEKLYRKLCVRKGSLRDLNYNSERHASIIFTLCLDEIQGSKNHFSTWLHPTRLHSGEDQSFQLHIGGKKIGVNKTANPEDVFKTCHLK